jgi:hypothetical protein
VLPAGQFEFMEGGVKLHLLAGRKKSYWAACSSAVPSAAQFLRAVEVLGNHPKAAIDYHLKAVITYVGFPVITEVVLAAFRKMGRAPDHLCCWRLG